MAKHKKFERKAPRPTLGASLEAVRQGKVLESQVDETHVEEQVERPIHQVPVSATGEAAFVKTEIKKITLIMGSLLGLLVILYIAELRTGLLTKTAERLLRSS